jgi:hypothetical protein
MLIYQISLVKVQRATDANNSNFIGQQAGEAATCLFIKLLLVMVLVIMQQMLHTQISFVRY